MRRWVALPLAVAMAGPVAVADDEPMCQYLGTTGTAVGNRPLANPCVGYSDAIACQRLDAGNGTAGVTVVTCRPEA